MPRDIGIFEPNGATGWAVRLASALLIFGLLGSSPAVAADHGAKKPPAEGAIAGPTFIKMPPIVLPVFSGGKVTRQAGLMVALELEAGKSEDDFEPNRRKLQDAFITDLYALYDQFGGTGRVIESTVIKEHLKDTCDRVLGPDVVHAVLLLQAFERVKR